MAVIVNTDDLNADDEVNVDVDTVGHTHKHQHCHGSVLHMVYVFASLWHTLGALRIVLYSLLA